MNAGDTQQLTSLPAPPRSFSVFRKLTGSYLMAKLQSICAHSKLTFFNYFQLLQILVLTNLVKINKNNIHNLYEVSANFVKLIFFVVVLFVCSFYNVKSKKY